MSNEEERIRQDWGSYKPETQKALRFVALHDQGAAKQIAGAIAHEYAESVQTKKPKRMRKSNPTKAEIYAAIDAIEDPFSRRVARAIHEKTPGWTL